MPKLTPYACLLLITVTNVVCAFLCVRTATQPAQRMSQMEPELVAIRTAVDQQTAVLNRAIGEVVPVKMPAGFESRFLALEAAVGDKNKWPTTSNESNTLQKNLKALIKELPVWAEPDYMPRLTPLRWSIHALSISNDQAGSADENNASVSAIDALLSAAPDGVSPEMLEALKKVVWALQDWKNLGPGTTVQLLDQPGIPENPGELQR